MGLAGDRGRCVEYLMGNHTIAQRMIGTIPLSCSTLLCVRRLSKMPTKSPGSPWTSPAHTLEASTPRRSLRSASNSITRWPRCWSTWAHEYLRNSLTPETHCSQEEQRRGRDVGSQFGWLGARLARKLSRWGHSCPSASWSAWYAGGPSAATVAGPYGSKGTRDPTPCPAPG